MRSQNDAVEPGSTRLIVGITILIAAMVIPALLYWGDAGLAASMREARGLCVGVIVAAGMVAGLLLAWSREPLWVGALCGGLCVVGGNMTLYYYSSWRTSLWKAEVLFAVMIGAIPAAVVFHLLRRKESEAPV